MQTEQALSFCKVTRIDSFKKLEYEGIIRPRVGLYSCSDEENGEKERAGGNCAQ